LGWLKWLMGAANQVNSIPSFDVALRSARRLVMWIGERAALCSKFGNWKLRRGKVVTM